MIDIEIIQMCILIFFFIQSGEYHYIQNNIPANLKFEFQIDHHIHHINLIVKNNYGNVDNFISFTIYFISFISLLCLLLFYFRLNYTFY